MAYDGEIRLKAVVDKSGIVDLEADLGEVEKKAGDAEKAVQDIKLDDSAEKSAKPCCASPVRFSGLLQTVSPALIPSHRYFWKHLQSDSRPRRGGWHRAAANTYPEYDCLYQKELSGYSGDGCLIR